MDASGAQGDLFGEEIDMKDAGCSTGFCFSLGSVYSKANCLVWCYLLCYRVASSRLGRLGWVGRD